MMPTPNEPSSRFPIKLQYGEGRSDHVLNSDTFLNKDLLPALEDARRNLGPRKAAYLLQESVRWMRSLGKLQTVEEVTYIINLLTAIQQEEKELPKWAPTQEDKLREAKADEAFQSILSKIRGTPYTGDDDMERMSLSPDLPISPASGGATFVPTGSGDDSMAHGSLHVEFSCTRSQVDDVISELKWEVEAAADRLKDEYPNVTFHISTSTATVQ